MLARALPLAALALLLGARVLPPVARARAGPRAGAGPHRMLLARRTSPSLRERSLADGSRDSALGVVLATVRALVANHVPQMSAALAYYSALSLAPLVIITLGVTGLVVDRNLMQEHLAVQVERLLGPEGAGLVRTLGREQRLTGAGTWATIAGLVMLVLAASGVFVQLQDGLNRIWGVRARRHGGLILFLRTRLISMALVFSVGAVLLASMLVNAAVSAMGADLGTRLGLPAQAAVVIQVGSSFVVTTALLALLYRWLPEAEVVWRAAWAGALLTALLFHLGAWAIGLYVRSAAIGSAYGAAGSLVVLLVWVYYASLTVFTGAQFAAVLAGRAAARRQPGVRA
jgi:membrane protein